MADELLRPYPAARTILPSPPAGRMQERDNIMDHKDHLDLIHKGVKSPTGTWADFGSGRGAFTLALADLLEKGGTIYSIDQNRDKLEDQKRRMRARFPTIDVRYMEADYRSSLDVPPLDGIVIANALHFQEEKGPVLDLFHSYLQPSGQLILVEYNADRGNRWVPHPLSYDSWEKLAQKHGFIETRLLATKPSHFLGQIYAAASKKGENK